MRFCQPHWAELRAAIAERSLGHLVAEGGEQAVRNLAAELTEGPRIQTFDPLMAAHNAIWMNAMERVGLDLMMPDEAGEQRCPICFVNAEAPKHGQAATFADDWIVKAADGAKRQADELLKAAEPDA
jgi:hypothetical protein